MPVKKQRLDTSQSYTQLTVNAHEQSLMGRMRRPGQGNRAGAGGSGRVRESLKRPTTGASELLKQYPLELLHDEAPPKPPAPRKAYC